MRLGTYVTDAAKQIKDLHFQQPEQTVRHLIQGLLGWKALEIFLNPDRILSDEQQTVLNEAVSALKSGKPLAYVLGEMSFLEWDFKIDDRAFIPRPETEALVAMVRDRINSRSGTAKDETLEIIDLCCGSGAMGLGLALSFPESRLTLAELSDQAIELTKENVELHHLSNRTRLIKTDLWKQVPSDWTFDVILCNPPYVAGSEHVDSQVLEFEPHLALFSDDSGMAHVKSVLKGLDCRLNTNGIAAFELGHRHCELLNPWLENSSFHGTFSWVEDPFGVPRFLFYQK